MTPEEIWNKSLVQIEERVGGNIIDLWFRPIKLSQLKEQQATIEIPNRFFTLCARYLHHANTPWIAPDSFQVLDDPGNNIVAQAAEGTLFLHEVSDLTAAQQRNLLLQIGQLERCHTRLICSTSRTLAHLVSQGSFDSRLYAAISQVQLRVPELREHPEDSPDIAKLTLNRLVEAKQVPPRVLSTAALNALRVSDWPGNLTQLENVVRTLALLMHETGRNDRRVSQGRFCRVILPDGRA